MKTITINDSQSISTINSLIKKITFCAFIFLSIFYYSKTNAQAVLVKNINAGSGNSTPGFKVKIGTTFYFAADDGVNGAELWKSNGTATGTVMVKDINPTAAAGSSISNLVNLNGTLVFAANDGTNGLELWKSDGTTGGTVMIKDIQATLGASSNPASLVVINSTVFFSATDGTNGIELWKSDGTNAGTVMVKNINTGAANASPTGLARFNDTLYFSASNGSTNGAELWKSDGTNAGTVMVKDIFPGVFASSVANLTVAGNFIYFSATDGTFGLELWKSNGTAAGTVRVRDIQVGSADGLTLGSANLKSINDTLYFCANDFTNGIELWKTNGDSVGTVMMGNINIGANASSPANLTEINNMVMFSATNGTGAGNHGIELWKSNGTAISTVLVKDINFGVPNSAPTNFINASDTLFFTATDGSNGVELWKSDGTVIGTSMIANINPGSASSSPTNIIEINDTLYFSATDGTNGIELWRYNPCYLPLVDITKTVSGGQVCSGTNGTVTITASQANVSYQAFMGVTPVGSPAVSAGGNLVLTIPSASLALGSNTISVVATGCSLAALTDTAAVVVNAIPVATVTGGAAICAGGSTPVTFSFTGTGPWTLTYTNGSSNFTPSAISTSPFVLNATGAGTYSVVSVNDANCPGTFSGSAVVTVFAIPTANVSGGDTICPGSTTPVNFAFTGTGPWDLTYTDGTTPTTVNGIATSPYTINTGVAGIYSIVSFSDANCTGTQSGSATVGLFSTFPTATVSGGGTTCSASLPVNFALTGTPPWDLTYSIGSSNFTVTNIMTSPYTLTATVNGVYKAVSIEDGNCTGTVSDSAIVNLVSPPTANISGTGSICPGGSDTLSILLTGTPPWNLSYQINGGSTTGISTITSSPYYLGVTTAGTYTVSIIQDAVCVGTPSGSAVVSNVTIPTANIFGSVSICPGETDTLSITLAGTPPWNIEYSDGSVTTPVSGILASPYLLPVNAIGTYTLTSVNDANCIGTPSGSGTVTGLTAPTATISGSGVICFLPPSADTLSVALTGAQPWNFTYTNGTITVPVTAVTSSPYELILSDTGTYTITTVEDANCAAIGSGSGTIVYNNINSLLASFSYVINGLQVTFTNTSQNGNIYLWHFGDTDTSTAVNPSHTYTASGDYDVTLLVSDGCSADDTTITISLGVGIEEGPIASSLQYYPNPVREVLSVKLNTPQSTSMKLRMLKANGQVVYEEQMDKFSGDYFRTINVSEFASGFYFVQIITDSEVVNRKITITK